tara:strand:- start:6956 stop:7369 length:414 start_codon:yes stop_codon:yes gene_type:complete
MRLADRNVLRRRASDDDRIMPLINVVFLLLIFFMLAGQLSASDPFEITPPESISIAESGDEEMLVLVGKDGRLALNGKTVGERVLIDTLRAAPEAKRELIRLKADNNAPAAALVSLMGKLREAGVLRIRLLTVRGDS